MRRTSLKRQPKSHGFFILKTNREVLPCNKNRQLNIFRKLYCGAFQVGDKEKSTTFFTLKIRRNVCKIIIGIARRERYKLFTTKIFSKERTIIKTTFKTFQFSFVLLRRSRYFFNGHKLPARANDTKREAIWYSELYLSFFDICGTYKARKIGNDKRRCGKVIENFA